VKLIETDVPVAEDELEPPAPPPRPPRPEHRRVAVSLILTVGVLVGTVVAVYLLVPERHNELMTRTVEAPREPGELELEAPSPKELSAWSTGVVGRGVPWPVGDQVEIVGAHAIELLRRPVAIAHFRVAGRPVTVAAQRNREAVARTHRREHRGVYLVSWRRDKWTFVAAGPATDSAAWRDAVGAP
jgi:hypothetical protein